MNVRRWKVLGVVLFGLSAGWGQASRPVSPAVVARGETPDHWQLTPAGVQVEIGDRPMGRAATPDGRYLVVSNNGQGVQSLVLFDTFTDKVVQVIP